MYLTFPSCKFDYCMPQCPCDPLVADLGPEKLGRYRKAPEHVLRPATGEPVDLEALKAIAVFATREDGVRSPQLERHFVKMILEGYELPNTLDGEAEFKLKRCHWELPLVGIYNMLVSIRRDATMSFGDKAILANICGDYDRIVDAVLKDLQRLLPAGQHADHLRNTIVKTTAILAENRKFKEGLLRNQKAISLILTCWTHMSAPSRDDVNALIHELYEECGGCNPTSADPQRHMRAVHVLGVDTLVQRFEGWLTNPRILDQALQLELQTIYDFLRGSPPYGKVFVAAQTQAHVMTAMQRQKQRGDAAFSQMVYHLGFNIVTILTSDPDYLGSIAMTSEILPDSIELAMFALSADSESREVALPPAEDVCRWHSGYRALEDMGYYEYIAKITLECDAPSRDGGHKETSFFTACTAQMEKIYIPVSRRLLVRSIEGYSFAKDVHFLWKRLADALGMTEATVRAKWEQNGECWNPWCAQRGDRSVKMKWCKRCFTVTYCSTACQKANWEEHKWTCKANPTATGSRSRTTTGTC